MRALGWLLLLGTLALVVVLGVTVGAVPLGPDRVLAALADGLAGRAVDPIVWQIRLPRVLMAALVGAALGVSGAVYQGLFRNPLADPYLMGAASGAAFGATVALTLTGSLSSAYAHSVAERWPASVPLFAFAGAVGAVALAVVLAGGVVRRYNLILAGVVVGSVLIGLTTYLMMLDADRVRAVFSYTLGNLAFSGWPDVQRLAAYLVVALLPLFFFGRALNALQLGDAVAHTLGLPLAWIKLGLILGATLATAAAVAQVGIVGFVGLIVPHTMRRFAGEDYRALVPASALGGAVLLVLADVLARMLVRPAELPVGVVTTLLGGPFFLYLLRRQRA
ncbi:FecCD family ABC transporter permease [Oceanithermus desulfurans]